MATPDAAVRHYSRQQRLTAVVLIAARREWDRVGDDFDAGWRRIGPRLVGLVATAQRSAVADASVYVPQVLAELGVDASPVARVNPPAFAGIASDGRPLATLLREPVIRAKTRVAGGADIDEALTAGRSQMDMIVRTQIADAARSATQVAMGARPSVTHYARMLNPPSCSRCAVLAGRIYRMQYAFQRHPSCDCRHIPATEATAQDLTTSPSAYFDSLDVAQQNQIFTNAGADAIREGADIGQVVNARRGMDTAARFTTTGSRGRARLMPETIFELATSRDAAIAALRQHGYLL